MKRRTKQFFAAALAACILGAASMPAYAATDSQKEHPSNDQFFAQVQNVISDYWQDDYDTEIRFTAGEIGAQVDGKTVGNQIGCEVTEDGDFLISAETFSEVTGEPFNLGQIQDGYADTPDEESDRLWLTVQSAETPIMGSEYGAVQTVENGSGLYILQFDSAEDTQAAYETFASMEGVEIVEDDPPAEEIPSEPEQPDDILLPADTIAEEFGYEIVSQDEDSITFTKSFQTMRLIVDSPKHIIRGSDYGAVQTIEDGNGIYVLQFDRVEDTKAAYESLSKISGVIVEEDAVVSLEEAEETETDTQAFHYRSWGAKRIGADQWVENMTPEQKKQEVVVAVLDTGVSSSHADFTGKLLDGISMMDKDYTFDQHSHGTHVAGTVVDLTQGTNVKILPVQVLDPVTGKGTTLSAASGVQWASEHGADVINMSLTAKTGVASGSHYLDRAVNQAVANQVVVVAAAGNAASETDLYCPAHIPELLCVSAIDSKDQLASFSNYGSAVDLAAPGVSIQSAVPNGYGYKSGTSMAAPHVAAAAALVKTALPDATSSKIGSLLTESSDDLGDAGWDEKYGSGVVNLANLSPTDLENPPESQKPNKIILSNVQRDTTRLTVHNLPARVTSVILKDSSGKALSIQIPVNGSVSFTGLSSSTSYQIVACNDSGESEPLTVSTKYQSKGSGGSSGKKSSGNSSQNKTNEDDGTLVTKPADGVVSEGVTNLPKLDTSTVQIATGGSYCFLVNGNHDTANIQVTVSDPAVASVCMDDANDSRGARYRVTAKAAGMVQIDVTYQGATTPIQVEIVPAKGSLTLDTSSYLMAPGDSYTIGTFLKDENGNTLTSEQVQELIDTGKFKVQDSRTGSIFDLTQLDNGNVQVTGKNEGVAYVLYEINGVRASVRVTVQPDVAAQGNSSYRIFHFCK